MTITFAQLRLVVLLWLAAWVIVTGLLALVIRAESRHRRALLHLACILQEPVHSLGRIWFQLCGLVREARGTRRR